MLASMQRVSGDAGPRARGNGAGGPGPGVRGRGTGAGGPGPQKGPADSAKPGPAGVAQAAEHGGVASWRGGCCSGDPVGAFGSDVGRCGNVNAAGATRAYSCIAGAGRRHRLCNGTLSRGLLAHPVMVCVAVFRCTGGWSLNPGVS